MFPVFSPNSAAVGDLDGDGDADVVVGREYHASPGISVLKNAGDGTFSLPVHYNLSANRSVGEVALADFDSDSDRDVLATVPGTFGQLNRLAVYRNTGNGTLAPPIEFTTGMGPVGLAIADFTGDGFFDVVTANFESQFGTTVSLLRHNGQTGTAAGFLTPLHFPAGNAVERVAVGDLNGDNLPDLAVGRTELIEGFVTGIFSVLFNTGTSGFSTPTDYSTITAPAGGSTAVAMADLDNDGDRDLIGAGTSDFANRISIRRNAGNGTFGPPELHAVTSAAVRRLSTADLNADGYPDILAAGPSGTSENGWNLLLSNGAGGYLSATRYVASENTVAVVAADADGDGDRDVFSVSNYAQAITVHQNPGTGIFATPPQYSAGAIVRGIDSADVDHDGDLDIVSSDSSAVQTLLGAGNGTFAPPIVYVPPVSRQEIRLRDLNGDQYPDLLMLEDQPPYRFATALNNGDGSFATGIVHFGSSGGGTIDAFDLDNDGDRDVVVTDAFAVTPFGDQRIRLFRNDGNQVFVPMPPLVPVNIPNGIAAADFNGDGYLDLATGSQNNGFGTAGTGVFRGNGNFTFQPPLVTGATGNKWTLADLNSDGKLDVAAVTNPISFGSAQVSIGLGTGTGMFSNHATFAGASTIQSGFAVSFDIDTADITGDELPDLLIANSGNSDLSVFANTGMGNFGRHERYGAGFAPRYVFGGDYTGDGAADALTLVGLPPGGIANAIVVLPGIAPAQVTAIKVNDGAPQRSRVTSITVSFNQLVNFAGGSSSAFELRRQSDNAIVTLNASVMGNAVTLAFTGGPVEFTSLTDGRYTLTVFGSQVNAGNFDGNGDGIVGDDYVLASAVAPDPPTNIFRFFGDNDGDGDADTLDFLAFRATSGLSAGEPGFNAAFDYDDDGDVDAVDFLAFRSRFGGGV